MPSGGQIQRGCHKFPPLEEAAAVQVLQCSRSPAHDSPSEPVAQVMRAWRDASERANHTSLQSLTGIACPTSISLKHWQNSPSYQVQGLMNMCWARKQTVNRNLEKPALPCVLGLTKLSQTCKRCALCQRPSQVCTLSTELQIALRQCPSQAHSDHQSQHALAGVSRTEPSL